MLVGVFSREPESTYKWLINFLLELPDVKDVRPVYINNNSSQNFNDEVAKCSFAILYHSLNRGRINVTNVTDSIYDRELDYLSNTKDREKILVVIDDLDDSSDLERARILQTQPSIGRLAGELFLFSKAEKACLRSSGSRTNGSIGLQNLNAADTLNEKLTSMKRILKGKRTGGFSYNDNFTGGTDSPFSGNTGAFSGTRNNSLWEMHRPWLFPLLVILLVLLVVVIAVPLSTKYPEYVGSTTPFTTSPPEHNSATASIASSTSGHVTSSTGYITVTGSSSLKTETTSSSPEHSTTSGINTTSYKHQTDVSAHSTATSESSTTATTHSVSDSSTVTKFTETSSETTSTTTTKKNP